MKLIKNIEYRNAVWIGENEVECMVDHPEHGWIPRSCHRGDKGGDVDNEELLTRIALDPNVPAWTPDRPAEREMREFLKENEVGARLSRLDAFVSNPLRWELLDNIQKDELRQYRRALINMPQQKGWPDIDLPPEPEFPK